MVHKQSFDSESSKSGNTDEYNLGKTVMDYKPVKLNAGASTVEVGSAKTIDGLASNSSRTKEDEHVFDLSFEEDFFLDLQKGGIDLDQ
jgi:hypothetical protein